MSIVDVAVEVIGITIAGLFIAFSPMLLIVNLLIVTHSKRPILHTVILLVSTALPLLLLGLVANLLLSPEMDISFRGISQHLSLPPLIDIAIGSALMTWSVRRIIRHQNTRAAQMNKPQSITMPTTKPLPLFVFGFTKSLLSVSNIFAVLFVTKLTLERGLPAGVAFVVLVWAVAIGMTPFFAILYYSRSHPDHVLTLQAKIDTMLNRNIKLYVYVAAGLIGFWLFINGVLQEIA